jgi:hypothetical protein
VDSVGEAISDAGKRVNDYKKEAVKRQPLLNCLQLNRAEIFFAPIGAEPSVAPNGAKSLLVFNSTNILLLSEQRNVHTLKLGTI